MGRHIQGSKPGTQKSFTPKAFGNAEDREPVRIWYSLPTEAGRRALFAEIIEGAKDAESVNARQAAETQQETVRKYVTQVDNYSFRGVTIDDGETLAEHGEFEFIAEAAEKILGDHFISDAELKKSTGSRHSTSTETPASNGATTRTAQKVEREAAGLEG